MKKRKLLIFGGLVASATTLGSIATLISCNKDEPQKPWLSIDQKTILIEDGRTGTQDDDNPIQFVFNSSVDIEVGANITATLDGEYSEDNDFNVELKVGERTETKQIPIDVTLFSKTGAKDKDDIYNDSHATFNIKVQWTGEDGKVLREQVVENLKIDFFCQGNDISVLNEGEATNMPSSEVARLSFDLGTTSQRVVPSKDEQDILVDVKNVQPEPGSKITDVKAVDWQVNETTNQLVVSFQLLHTDPLADKDTVKFDIRMRCVDKADNKVHWDYQNVNPFIIHYSDLNTYFDDSQLYISGVANEAGTNTQEYTIYYWKEIKYDEGEITFDTEIKEDYQYKDDVKITLGEPTVTTVTTPEGDVYNKAVMTATFTDGSDQPLDDDYDIPFKFKFGISGHHGITEDEETDDCTFCYRTEKLDDVSSITKKTPFDVANTSFDLTLLDTPAADYTFKYNVITSEEQYIPYSEESECTVVGTTLTSSVSIKASEGKLVNGNTGNFALQIIGVDGNGVEQWKQTTESNLNIQYRSSIDDYINTYDIKNGVLTGEISFTLGDETSTNLTAGAAYNIEKQHFNGIEFGTITREGKNGKIPYTLDPRIDLKFDGSIKFDVDVSGEATGADPWTYTLKNITINYNNGVYIEEKELDTDFGSSSAMYEIEFKPEWKPAAIGDITIAADVTESSIDGMNVGWISQASSYNPTTGILNACIEMSSNTRNFTADDYANFSLTISSTNIPPTTISDLKLTYTTAFKTYDTVKTTEPGVYSATYEFEFQNEISTDPTTTIEVTFDGEKPEELDNFVVERDQSDNKILYVTVTADEETIQPDDPVNFKLNFEIHDKFAPVNHIQELTSQMTFYYDYRADIEGEKVQDVEIDMEDSTRSAKVTYKITLTKDTFEEGATANVIPEIISSDNAGLEVTSETSEEPGEEKVLYVYVNLKDDVMLLPGSFSQFSLILNFVNGDDTWSQTFEGFKLTAREHSF